MPTSDQPPLLVPFAFNIGDDVVLRSDMLDSSDASISGVQPYHPLPKWTVRERLLRQIEPLGFQLSYRIARGEELRKVTEHELLHYTDISVKTMSDTTFNAQVQRQIDQRAKLAAPVAPSQPVAAGS